MSQQIQRNNIIIELNPNNYYTQLPKSQRDTALLKQVTITPIQIKKLEIFKSYVYHVTDVIVEIDNLDPQVAILWGEGKYIAKLTVGAETRGDNDAGFENYFVCYDLKMTDTPAEFTVHGAAPTVGAVVILKSITRTRLEAENNFTFELGGKNGTGAAGGGKAPIQFLHDDLMELYSRNYMESGAETSIPWDTTYVDMIDQQHQIHTTPSNGYKIITNTNMEALEFFFKHYPIFNTSYDWVLDDCNTSTTGLATNLKLADFVWWPAWEPHINIDLSNVMNRTIPEEKTSSSAEFRTLSILRFHRITLTEHVSYHDWVKYYVKNGYAKIWAVDVSSGKPIPMHHWNARHQFAAVMTPNGSIKTIPNPMYQEYLTFMTYKEIEETQLYKNTFQNLHPILQKFTFSNVFVGDVDIHTIVEFKLDKINTEQKYDRLGMGYQVLHTYTRSDLQPKELTEVSSSGNDSKPENSQFNYTFALTSEVIFLVIDKGDLDIAQVGKEDAANLVGSPTDHNFTPYDPCASASDVDGGMMGTDGSNLPGNTSIRDQAMSMYKQGFKYVYGGKKSLAAGIDCSGFTRLAISRAGVGGYGHGTWGQQEWCKKHAATITGTSNVKAGDILFFRWGGTGSWGHTGIAINSTQYVHSSGGSANHAGNPGIGATISTHKHMTGKVLRIYRIKT